MHWPQILQSDRLLEITLTLVYLLSDLTSQFCIAQVRVDVNLDVKHVLEDVETFDRKKFISIHATLDEKGWETNNVSPNLRDEFLNGYDVYVGRNTGAITYTLKNRITEDPTRPGYADPASIAREGQALRKRYAALESIHPYENRSAMIICTQLHPFYPDGEKTNKGWAFSQADTKKEPFGTASGEYYGRFIKQSFSRGRKSGEPRPTYCEVVNEPLWDLVTNGDEDPAKIFRFHKTVARQIRKYNPGLPVGGYCAAFPDFDKDNFERWHQRWKLFMDIAGAEMDFWSIHMYDFPCIGGGKQRYRKGSNMEATLDMLEQYSHMSFGEVKPFLVTEYSAQTHDYMKKPWSPYRDWLRIKSTNSMMIQYMERANNIVMAVPFLMLKSEWHYKSEGRAHTARIMRRENEPEDFSGKYVYADTAKIYQLWSDVKGTRVDCHSTDPDILCDTYVDGNKAYVIINNLEFEPVRLRLNVQGTQNPAKEIEVRHCYLEGGKDGVPKLLTFRGERLKGTIEIGAEATLILTYNYGQEIAIENISEEKKYYADTYLRPIKSNTPIGFQINGVRKGRYGEAMLRIGVGRDHGKKVAPNVIVNGQSIKVPTDHRGGPQADRDNFFGVLEVPVPYKLVKPNNEVLVAYPDHGGYVSTVTMQVYNFSNNIRRKRIQ